MKGQTTPHLREAKLQRQLRNAPTDAERNEESDVERLLDALATALKPSPSRGGLGGDGVGPPPPMKGQTSRHIREAKLQRQLRNAPTDAERTLWQHLKGRQLEGCKFRRQHPFGDYILDFACLERGVVVELDGSQHADAAGYDARRTRFLEGAGFVVLRFWNNDVFGNLEGVLEAIQVQLIARAGSGDFVPVRTPSPPNPPLEGEG